MRRIRRWRGAALGSVDHPWWATPFSLAEVALQRGELFGEVEHWGREAHQRFGLNHVLNQLGETETLLATVELRQDDPTRPWRAESETSIQTLRALRGAMRVRAGALAALPGLPRSNTLVASMPVLPESLLVHATFAWRAGSSPPQPTWVPSLTRSARTVAVAVDLARGLGLVESDPLEAARLVGHAVGLAGRERLVTPFVELAPPLLVVLEKADDPDGLVAAASSVAPSGEVARPRSCR